MGNEGNLTLTAKQFEYLLKLTRKGQFDDLPQITDVKGFAEAVCPLARETPGMIPFAIKCLSTNCNRRRDICSNTTCPLNNTGPFPVDVVSNGKLRGSYLYDPLLKRVDTVQKHTVVRTSVPPKEGSYGIHMAYKITEVFPGDNWVKPKKAKSLKVKHFQDIVTHVEKPLIVQDRPEPEILSLPPELEIISEITFPEKPLPKVRPLRILNDQAEIIIRKELKAHKPSPSFILPDELTEIYILKHTEFRPVDIVLPGENFSPASVLVDPPVLDISGCAYINGNPAQLDESYLASQSGYTVDHVSIRMPIVKALLADINSNPNPPWRFGELLSEYNSKL